MNDPVRDILNLLAHGRIPEEIPRGSAYADELQRLVNYFTAIQHFTIAMANGDLTASLKGVGGSVAGSLKSLQASLRHLTWQTRQVAAGDFSQRVDFMGDFSAGFNSMVSSLAVTRAEMALMNIRLRKELDQQRAMAETLRHKEERFRLITENVNAVIWTMDAATLRYTYMGPYINILRGMTVEEALLESFPESITPVSWDRVRMAMENNRKRFQQTGDIAAFSCCFEVEQSCNNGRMIHVEMVVSAIADQEGELKEFLGISRDITARKALENELTFQSNHDALTGLYNRAFLDTALERIAGDGPFPLSIIVADLDGLKIVNDTFGHSAGDRLIKGAAAVLTKAFRADDVIARVGGDEFVVLLPCLNEVDAVRLYERVRNFEAEFNRAHPGPPLKISLGGATAHGGEDIAPMLKRADARMYAEKAMRKQQGV